MRCSLTQAALVSIIVVLTLASCAAPNTSSVPLTSIANDPESLGVINLKGAWVVPPRYQEVVFVKKLSAFWVKVRQPSGASAPLINFGSSSPWKLLDRNGREIKSELPSDEEPLQDWPPTQAPGFSTYPGAMPVNGKAGAGIADADGKPLTADKYHYLQEAGDGFWLARPGQKAARNANESLFPNTKLGNIYDLPPALILFDPQGKKVNVLPEGIFLPDGYFSGGLLVCKVLGGRECAIDKTGNVVISPRASVPMSSSTRKMRDGAPRSFNSFYNLPVSASKPVKLIDISKKTGLPSEIEPVAVAEGLALAPTQDDMVGLINRKGEWVMPPEYNRLAYCDADRFVCSKGRLTMEQQKKQKLEFSAPDIR